MSDPLIDPPRLWRFSGPPRPTPDRRVAEEWARRCDESQRRARALRAAPRRGRVTFLGVIGVLAVVVFVTTAVAVILLAPR